MHEATLAARVVRALLDFAVSKGAGRPELMERSGISAAELEDQETRVPLEKYVALMGAGKELCKDPAFALHFGEEIQLSDISLLPFLGSTPGDSADDLRLLNRFGRLDVDFGEFDRFQISQIDGQLWLIDARPNPNDFPEHTEALFARAVCEIRRLKSDVQFVSAIHVTHDEPAYSAEYARIFQVPVFFQSDNNALLFSDGFWPTAETALLPEHAAEILRTHAETLLENLQGKATTRGSVEVLLMPLLPTQRASVETIAGALGLSRQTLYRKLRAEGVTFEKLLDELRHKLALHFLVAKRMSVSEVTHLLGFSESAAFSRAFKRWTGSSPSAVQASAWDSNRGHS